MLNLNLVSENDEIFSKLNFPGGYTVLGIVEDFVVSLHPNVPAAHNKNIHSNILRKRISCEATFIPDFVVSLHLL